MLEHTKTKRVVTFVMTLVSASCARESIPRSGELVDASIHGGGASDGAISLDARATDASVDVARTPRDARAFDAWVDGQLVVSANDCEAVIDDQLAKCDGDVEAQCTWRALRARCRTGVAGAIAVSASCLSSARCQTFKDVDDATTLSCLRNARVAFSTFGSTELQRRSRTICRDERLFSDTAELQAAFLNSRSLENLLASCVVPMDACSTISGCIQRAFRDEFLCSSEPHVGHGAGDAGLNGVVGDGGAIVPEPVPANLVARCESRARELRMLCTEDSRAQCLWGAYAGLCRTGNPVTLLASMDCLSSTTCSTFSMPGEGGACIEQVYNRARSGQVVDTLRRLSLFCTRRPFTSISELQWIHLTSTQVLNISGCITKEGGCSTADGCMRRDYSAFPICASDPSDRTPFAWVF